MQDKLIPLTGLWENKSKNGTRYFSGVLGKAKILLLPNKNKQKDSDPGWTVFVAEREPKPQQTQTDGIPDPGEPMSRRAWPGGREPAPGRTDRAQNPEDTHALQIPRR